MTLEHACAAPADGPRHEPAGTWTRICPPCRITPDTGVAAWVGGEQVALFRLGDGRFFAIDNRDPASGANVLARGIVGDSRGRAVVASPVYKQRFDLETGQCLDDPSLRVRSWDVRVVDGVVAVSAQPVESRLAEPV